MTERVAAAFAEGHNGDLVTAQDFMTNPKRWDLVVCFGLMRGPRRCLQYAVRRRMPFVQIDHAYFNSARGYTGRSEEWNFRCTLNGFQAGPIVPREHPRLHQIRRVRIQKYRGDKPLVRALVCPPSAATLAFFPDAAGWLPMMRRRLKAANIAFEERAKRLTRKHPPISWGHVRMLLTYNSSLALEAMTKGIPFYTEGAGKDLRTEPEDIKNPVKGDRIALMNHLSWSQFSVNEMRHGEVLPILMGEA